MRTNTNKMRKRIIELCKINSKYANNDLALIAAIWEREGWRSDYSLYDNLRSVSHPETIRRTRQRLQQEGLVPKREKTNEKRYQEFKQVKLDLGYY